MGEGQGVKDFFAAVGVLSVIFTVIALAEWRGRPRRDLPVSLAMELWIALFGLTGCLPVIWLGCVLLGQVNEFEDARDQHLEPSPLDNPARRGFLVRTGVRARAGQPRKRTRQAAP